MNIVINKRIKKKQKKMEWKKIHHQMNQDSNKIL